MLLLHTLTMRGILPSGLGGDSMTDKWMDTQIDTQKNNAAFALTLAMRESDVHVVSLVEFRPLV